MNKTQPRARVRVALPRGERLYAQWGGTGSEGLAGRSAVDVSGGGRAGILRKSSRGKVGYRGSFGRRVCAGDEQCRDGFRRLSCGADYGTARVTTCGGAHAMRLRCCDRRGRMRNRSQAADAAGGACEWREHQQQNQCECEMYAARHRCFSVARGLFASEATFREVEIPPAQCGRLPW
jgi:hypothetical protein